MHGTTFGGGPFACAVALEFLSIIEDEKLLENVRLRGAELREGLTKLASQFDFIREIRAEGLMIGIELSVEGAPFVAEAMQLGLLINCTHDFTLRLLPPFIITRAQVREFLKLFDQVLAKTPKQAAAPDAGNASSPGRVAHAAARG
jgi:acetylornithine/succinyldiaminopimelate/putrescine aminotransferase